MSSFFLLDMNINTASPVGLGSTHVPIGAQENVQPQNELKGAAFRRKCRILQELAHFSASSLSS